MSAAPAMKVEQAKVAAGPAIGTSAGASNDSAALPRMPGLGGLPDLPSVAPAADAAVTIVDTHLPPLAELAAAQLPGPAPEVAPPAPEAAIGAPAIDEWSAPPVEAPTPWSEPVAAAPPESAEPAWMAGPATSAVEQPAAWEPVPMAPPVLAPQHRPWDMKAPAANEAVATEEVVWSSPPPEEASVEWAAPAAPGWQEPKKPDAVAPVAPPEADAAWGTMGDSPDWAAAPAAPAQEESWGAPPPAAGETDWSAAPPVPAEEWSAPSLPPPAQAVPTLPPPSHPEPKKAAPAWNAPAVGASALEQLESETMEAEPGAAGQLFGSVNGPLSGDNDDTGLPEELASPEQFLRPVELASPEEVLKPIEVDHNDPDLPVPIETPAPPPKMALAQMRPASFGALEVAGEHRVAVHMRRGGTRRGTLRDVDLSKSSFSLLPQGGGAAEAVYHAEVKAIFFMLSPGEKPKPPDGRKVVVTFADGRTIEGLRDGADAKHGFFLVPADAARTNTRRIYVSREATSDIKDG